MVTRKTERTGKERQATVRMRCNMKGEEQLHMDIRKAAVEECGKGRSQPQTSRTQGWRHRADFLLGSDRDSSGK